MHVVSLWNVVGVKNTERIFKFWKGFMKKMGGKWHKLNVGFALPKRGDERYM